MADAAFKPERDFSSEADRQIPEAEQLAKVPDTADAWVRRHAI